MSRSSDSKLRLLRIKEILERRSDETHPVSTPALIDELARDGIEVERKAVYDDVAALIDFGMDIVSTRRGYYVAKRSFQLPELKLLVDAVQSSRFITRRKSDQLIRAIASLASEHDAAELRRQVHVSGQIKAMNETIYYNVDALSAAMSAAKQVSFRYFDRQVNFENGNRFVKVYGHGGRQYRTSPWALIWCDENYYLIAYDEASGDIRHYRVDKMEGIRQERAPRLGGDRMRDFDPGEYTRSVFGMFGGKPVQLRIRFENKLAGVVADRFGDDTFVSRGDDDGHFTAVVEAVPSSQFFGWLVGLDGGARILSPDSVRESYEALCLRCAGKA